MTTGTLFRMSAFPNGPSGGNPAGVWLANTIPSAETMQQIAADVGYSETAFVSPRVGESRTIRYYSPEAEISFCGHATIAAGVVLGNESGAGTYRLATLVGEVPVSVRIDNGVSTASLTSVATRHESVSESLLVEALEALDWEEGDLDSAIPAIKAYAGAWHLVLAVTDSGRLSNLRYDFERLKSLMIRENITTLQLLWRESEELFHSRNPFPVGGVVEDPATGAAAAALAGYLRDAGLISVPAKITLRQGETMGRPSLIHVEIPVLGGIVVSGTAIEIE